MCLINKASHWFIINNLLFFILNQSEQCLLHVISGGVWIKTVQESTKNASYECSQIPRFFATLGVGKYNDSVLLSVKRVVLNGFIVITFTNIVVR